MIVVFRFCIELILQDKDLRDADAEKCRTGPHWLLCLRMTTTNYPSNTHMISEQLSYYLVLIYYLFIKGFWP
jgi:hypothetical protein